MKKQSLIIAGGGTGGHVYPALAIARAMKTINPSLDIIFVGTKRGIENRIIPKSEFKLELVPMGRFNNISFWERLKTILSLPMALLKSIMIILKYSPVAVLGVGGYASIPVVMVAALMGKSATVWEPNAYPGMANRLLVKFVKRALVVFEKTKDLLNTEEVVVVGLPVRNDIENMIEIEKPKGFNVLVFGGSLGARGINKVISQAVIENPEWLEGVNLVHQTGRLDFSGISKLYTEARAEVECREYLDDMPEQYAKADLVICRAGASTLAELAACGKPSLLIPFPGAADEHQKKNAENLAKSRAALMCEQNEFSKEYLVNLLADLKQNPARLDELARNIKKFHVPNAAGQIASIIISS